MPRPPRYSLIGVPQHMIQRRNNRQPTFLIEDDFEFYLECLKETEGRNSRPTPISIL